MTASDSGGGGSRGPEESSPPDSEAQRGEPGDAASDTVPGDAASDTVPEGAAPDTLPEAAAEPEPPGETYARRQNSAVALVFLGVGAVAALLSWQLGVGEFADPGPGLWPLVVSVAMAVLAGVLLLNPRPQGDEEAFGPDSARVAVGVASLCAFVLLFERVGYEIPTVALLVLWMRGLGRQSWLVTGTVTALGTAAVHVLFIAGLGVPLPHLVAV